MRLSVRNIALLAGTNGLAYLLSLLTASLFFPILFVLVVPNSTYGWWFVLILSSLGVSRTLGFVLCLVVIFNGIVFKTPVTFNNRRNRMLLGFGLGVIFFLGSMTYFRDSEEMLAFQHFLLAAGTGALFGYYHHRLVSEQFKNKLS